MACLNTLTHLLLSRLCRDDVKLHFLDPKIVYVIKWLSLVTVLTGSLLDKPRKSSETFCSILYKIFVLSTLHYQEIVNLDTILSNKSKSIVCKRVLVTMGSISGVQCYLLSWLIRVIAHLGRCSLEYGCLFGEREVTKGFILRCYFTGIYFFFICNFFEKWCMKWIFKEAIKCITVNKFLDLFVEINIFWAAHQAHHSSEDYNLTTALRQSVVQNYTSAVSLESHLSRPFPHEQTQ